VCSVKRYVHERELFDEEFLYVGDLIHREERRRFCCSLHHVLEANSFRQDVLMFLDFVA